MPLPLPEEPPPDEPEVPVDWDPPVVLAGAEGTNVASGLAKQELTAEATAAESDGAEALMVALPEKSQD